MRRKLNTRSEWFRPERYCNRNVPCDSCPATVSKSPDNHRFIGAQGPEKSEILIIGESPSKQANAQHIVVAGNGKVELEQTYLRLAGLNPDTVRITNVVKCAAPGFATPTPRLIDVCSSQFLATEILYCGASTIVTAGASALKPFHGSVVRDLGAYSGHRNDGTIDLEYDHGVPLRIEWKGMELFLVPMYGFGAGMVSAGMLQDSMEDWARLKEFRIGTYEPPEDAYPDPTYRRLRTPEEVVEVMAGHRDGILAIDTESLPDGSGYCLTFAMDPDRGYLIMRSDAEALTQFGIESRRPGFRITCHYLLHDEDTCAEMGIPVDLGNPLLIRDTMMDAYHLQLTSQGLKALSWRLLGIRMLEFLEVVGPPSLEQMSAYLEMASGSDWEGKNRRPRQVALHKKAARIRKILTEEQVGTRKTKPGAAPYNPWAAWSAIEPEQRKLAEDVLGPAPARSVEWVDEDNLLQYACQDAISTYRLVPVLEARARARRSRHSWT